MEVDIKKDYMSPFIKVVFIASRASIMAGSPGDVSGQVEGPGEEIPD